MLVISAVHDNRPVCFRQPAIKSEARRPVPSNTAETPGPIWQCLRVVVWEQMKAALREGATPAAASQHVPGHSPQKL